VEGPGRTMGRGEAASQGACWGGTGGSPRQWGAPRLLGSVLEAQLQLQSSFRSSRKGWSSIGEGQNHSTETKKRMAYVRGPIFTVQALGISLAANGHSRSVADLSRDSQ